MLPDPGITYADYNLNYNANQLNLQNGTPVNVTGTLNIWAVENIFIYVPKFKVLGAKSLHLVCRLPHHRQRLASCYRSWGMARILDPGGSLLRIRGFNWQI